jgi:hypothetical protein
MQDQDIDMDKIISGFKKHFQKSGDGGLYVNPDNHDQIKMAISVLHVESNERLAKSNEKYAKAMNWLTAGLLLVGITQIILELHK